MYNGVSYILRQYQYHLAVIVFITGKLKLLARFLIESHGTNLST